MSVLRNESFQSGLKKSLREGFTGQWNVWYMHKGSICSKMAYDYIRFHKNLITAILLHSGNVFAV